MHPNTGHSFCRTARKRCRSKNRNTGIIVLLTVLTAAVCITIFAVKSPPQAWRNNVGNPYSETETQTDPPAPPDPSAEAAEHKKKKSSAAAGYDYANPVPESETVENSYFDDAVFIGDSRTEGLILHTGLSNAIAYTHKGLMVDTVFTRPVIYKNNQKMSVMDALRQTDFRKVYIMLGINETGWPYSSIFIEKYGRIIDEIQSINPKAIIYVQEILPVTNSVSQTHSYVKNETIRAFNALIRQMAEEKQIYYIDTGAAVADADGILPEDAAVDGIHLKPPYCEQWLQYLKTHTVSNAEGGNKK